jgi:hypothetical protein
MIIYALSFLSLLSVLGISSGPFSGFTHHFTNPLVQKTVEQRALDIKLMKSVGAVWVREGIYWEEFEKEPGVYDFGKISPVIEQYEEAGIKVLGLFGYSNSLYAEHKFHFTSLAEDVELPAGYTETEYITERFAAAFFAVMQQFPYISHFQILNEMNGGKHFKAGSNYIETYRRLLAAVYPLAKANGKTIVTGGVLLGGRSSDWLAALSGSDFYNLYDVLAIHPYSYPNPLSVNMFGGKKFSDWLESIRQNWLFAGRREKPVWITELGWLFDRNISTEQRSWGWINGTDWLEMMAKTIRFCRINNIERLFLYSFEDDETINPQLDQSQDKAFFGVQRKNGTMKISPLLLRKTLGFEFTE